MDLEKLRQCEDEDDFEDLMIVGHCWVIFGVTFCRVWVIVYLFWVTINHVWVIFGNSWSFLIIFLKIKKTQYCQPP